MVEKDRDQQYGIDIVAAFAERTVKRLWITIIILIMIIGIAGTWIVYRETQFQTTETTITQENKDGYNNFIGNDGDIHNGETDDHGSDENQENER